MTNTKALVALLSGKERTAVSMGQLAHALAQFEGGQKTPVADTLGYMCPTAPKAKRLTPAIVRASVPLTKYRAAVLALASALDAVVAGEDAESVAGAFGVLVDDEKTSLKAAREASRTEAQKVALAERAEKNKAKAKNAALESAMGLVQAQASAGTLPAWFVAHMGEMFAGAPAPAPAPATAKAPA